MNSKFHFFVSIAKSTIRVMGCIGAWALNSVPILAIFLLFAELLGVLEELGDKR